MLQKPIKIGAYLCIELLGKGCFGQVYKATKDGENKFYAIKFICRKEVDKNPKDFEMFETECNVMHTINHPNILHLYEVLESTNNYYLVLEHCENGDLYKEITKLSGKSYLDEKKAVFYLKQIMTGYTELYNHKIMHRDIKLHNIFLTDNGQRVVIGDFGFAKKIYYDTNTILGTPVTMAPEVLIERVSYTYKADLWSIGTCYYWLLFGRLPFNNYSVAKGFDKVKKEIETYSGAKLRFPN